MRKTVWFVFLALLIGNLALGVELSPVAPEALGDWSQPTSPFRLGPTPPREVRYEGPTLSLILWGDVALGQASYAIALGVSQTGTPGLWVDLNRDNLIETEELASGGRGDGFYLWQLSLEAAPPTGTPYPYQLTILWPEGRGYVYLIGGAPRSGLLALEGEEHTFALVDADLNGVFGTEGDFYAVDIDGDGELAGGADGHEHFSITEPFTVGEKSYRLAWVAPDGSSVELSQTEYVPPKLPLTPGHPAPDFSFVPLRGGGKLSLSDLRGKVVLLDFWATWCGPCMEELPNVISIYQEFHDQGLEIIGISLDTSESQLRQVLQEKGMSWPQYFDGKGWENEIALLYRVFGIPATFLLDREGIIRYRDLRGQELKEKVAELLGEEEAPPPVEFSGPVVAPEPILEVSLPEGVGLAPGGAVDLQVQLANSSPYLAEEVALGLTDLPQGVEAKEVKLAELPGFGQRTLALEVRSQEGVPLGNYQAKLILTYHYCIGESCFQLSDELPLTLVVGEETTATKAPWSPWWVLVLIGVGVALAWLVFGRGVSALSILLLFLAGAAMGVGVYLGQAQQAQLIGAVICTSCVGIETERRDQPVLSEETKRELALVSRRIDLVVFHAPWCHSCPYAIAMAQEFSHANPNIHLELVDAEEEPDRALQAGVFRSGRLVVPAILNPATGEVIFGITDLEARLLALIQGR
ncbi:MAG: Alkyl hydroperoxide reductase/ Thiol specific antioxidant/ Mal allergen [Acetothermia bacterium 64_32]|nr:MAG: Alkyl hydroperoxide reductase/ Thiol specific antioxidant/ Mal allergen [Acetothermia bacterium 64_32]HAF70345.1 hypothetical protein [Candidatus Acetothermia bacterium]